jgi:periplasmic protein TonB
MNKSTMTHRGDFMRRGEQGQGDGSRAIAIGVAVVLHVLLFAALWQYAPLREAISDAIPVTVKFITPPEPEPPKPVKPPVIPPIRPRVQPPPRVEAPILTAPTEAPSPIAAPAPPPEPPPVVEAAAPVAAAPIISEPPRFNADYLQNPAPSYPGFSRRNGEQGKVILHVLVGADGRAKKVELRTSSGFDRLDNAALDTVAQWRFIPARQGDRAVEGWVLIPISFALKG